MSGTRLTRKVTVEGSKKLPESGGQSSSSGSGTRRSVFDRLGPGTSERARPREPYPPEKCRNWLRDGRCQFGRNCKFLHGPFSEPKQRTKSLRSVVRSDVDRSEERDEGGLGSRTRSLDSLEPEDEEEIPIKRKKSRTLEESADPGKKSEKLKRRQHVEKQSSEGEEENEDERKKRRKKVKKRHLSGSVVVTKSHSPEQEQKNWGDDDSEEERNEALDWEERGELDFERQLNLEKRRQDLQRQLALMDEEEAAREKAERKIREPKKDREEEAKPVVPVVHSKLHPEKSSVSPGDEFSPVSSQSTPKKKKKKVDGEAKKVKTKRKLSPAEKELKKRKGVKAAAEGVEANTGEERTRKITELSPEPSKSNISREQPVFEVVVEEKSRAVKKKQSKNKPKVNSGEDAYESPSDVVRRSQRPLPSEEIPRDKRAFSPEEQRQPAEKLRRRIALSSPETADSPTFRYASEERRRVTDLPDGGPRKPLHDVHGNRPPGESDYKAKSKGYDKRYRQEESPGGTPEHGRRAVVKDQRHVEEGPAERRKVIVEEPPPRSPSPEDMPPRGPITPPEEQRRRRTPPREDRRGPRTPPGEPEYDTDVQKHLTSERAPPRRRGPQTPPHPSTPPVRARFDKKREEIYEGRPESVPYREDLPRPKDRADRDTRYSRARGEEVADELSRGGRGHPPTEEDFPRSRVQDEEIGRARHRDDRQEDVHQRGRPRDDRADDFHRTRETEPERSDDHHRNRVDDPRGDEFQRRKPEGDDDYLRRREERDEGHFRGRNRELEKDDERHRRRDERGDEHQRGRGRDDYEDELQRPRGRDIPRRQFEGDDRHWEGRGERDSKEGQFIDRDRRRNDIPRQDMPDNRARERPGERPRDRDGRHPPPGPDYHRRTSPISHGPRRSPPPHGPPRGPHRYMERRRSLSPGGRRDEGYRPGPPRDQGGYGMGRETMRGRGGYSAPFDSRGRPMDDGRRRNSPPPRQYADRGRGAPRGRGARAGRGFPDRMRPPGDRFQEPPRDSRAPWDPERRREREHPRDRGRPHDESRDRERRPRSELSPGRGQRHWEDKRGGSPGRGSSPPRDRRAHEQEKIPREVEEDRRRRSENEEDEWEYEEDIGDDKERIPKQGERKRPRENTSSVSTTESPLAGKRRRSETPETEETAVPEAAEVGDKSGEAQPTTETPTKQTKPETGTPIKAVTKIKKKKAGKKEGKIVKSEGEGNVESHMTQETVPETEAQIESERQPKSEKKHKKDKVKTKEKATKKKKKSSTTSAEETDVVSELPDEPKNAPEEGGAVPSEKIGEAIQPSEGETISKLAKKRRHGDAPEGDETKGKGSDKPPKKKKKKKHQPEVVFQPWADLEGEDEDTSSGKLENSDQVSDKAALMQKDRENDGEKLTSENTGGKQDSSKVEEQVAVFSDWSDDSPIGDDTWSDINEPAEIADNKPKASEDVPTKVGSPVENSVPAYDDVYDPISDDELDAMLGDEDEEGGVGISGATGHASAPMAVEDVDWSALVTTQGSTEKTGVEPGSHLKRFTPGSVFSRIGVSSSLAGPRLTKLVQEACAKAANENPTGAETVEPTDVEGVRGSPVNNSIGALMAGAAAKRRERQLLFSDVGPCRRALCARKDLAMRKRLRRLTGKVGVFQTPPSAPVDNELYLMSVALYKHEQTSTDSSNGKLIPSRVGSVLATLTS